MLSMLSMLTMISLFSLLLLRILSLLTLLPLIILLILLRKLSLQITLLTLLSQLKHCEHILYNRALICVSGRVNGYPLDCYDYLSLKFTQLTSNSLCHCLCPLSKSTSLARFSVSSFFDYTLHFHIPLHLDLPPNGS